VEAGRAESRRGAKIREGKAVEIKYI